MRKITHYRAVFILHKNVKPSRFYDVKEKELFASHSKENHFLGLENANHHDYCSFYTKTENFVLSYSTLITITRIYLTYFDIVTFIFIR